MVFFHMNVCLCIYLFQTVRTRIFLVQLTHLDLAVGETGCHDYLTIIDLDVEDSTREVGPVPYGI